MLEVNNIAKYYTDTKTPAIAGVSFSLQTKKILSIFGGSGSGKTTLLKIIAGLLQPNTGQVKVDNEIIKGPEDVLVAGHEEIRVVFQDYQLKHMMTVEENINYALLAYEDEYRNFRLENVIKICLLEEYRHQYVHQLSGGQQQRVAIARAIANEPKLLLMDEPFSNLDLRSKTSLRSIIQDIVRQSESSILFVSHDPDEVLMLSDEIIVLEQGQVIQKGLPSTIYNSPVTLTVAEMFSPISLINWNDREAYYRPESIVVTEGSNFDFEAVVESANYLGKYQLLKASNLDHNIGTFYCYDFKNRYKAHDQINISLKEPIQSLVYKKNKAI